MRFLWLWLLALIALLLPTSMQAQSIQLHWAQYDNVVDVRRDGSFRVQEQQELVVDQGTLRRMTRSFETGDNGRVSGIQVSEDGVAYERSSSEQPGTYSGSDNGEQAEIQLFFRDPGDDRHDLTIEYTIQRAIEDNGDEAVLAWNFFWDDPDAPLIENGSVVINFPQAVDVSDLFASVDGPPVQQSFDGRTLRFDLNSSIQGQGVYIEAAFPRSILAADAQLIPSGSTTDADVPATGLNPSPAPAPASGFNLILCVLVLLFLLIAFLIIRSSARGRRTGGYSSDPTRRGPDPWVDPYARRRRRSRGMFFPPIIIPPTRRNRGPFDSPFSGPDTSDRDSGGSGSSWGDSSGSGSSWGDSGGSGSSWGNSGGSRSFWGGLGSNRRSGGSRRSGGGSRRSGGGGRRGGRGGGGFG